MTPDQLAQDLLNGGREQRLAAARLLATMGEEAAPAAAALVNLAGDADAGEWCVGALEELGPPPASELPALAKLCTADSEASAYWAATLLGRLGAEGAAAAGALASLATTHATPAARERAVWALGKIGPAAAEATPMLESIAAKSEGRIRRLAEQAIAAITKTV